MFDVFDDVELAEPGLSPAWDGRMRRYAEFHDEYGAQAMAMWVKGRAIQRIALACDGAPARIEQPAAPEGVPLALPAEQPLEMPTVWGSLRGRRRPRFWSSFGPY